MKVGFSMVYDVFHKKTIAFGGRDGNFDAASGTWAYDYTSGTWADMKPVAGPPWRSNPAMIYDRSRHKILLFGGDDFTRSYNDLWEYDYGLNTWAKLAPGNPPEARQMHGMAYDIEHDVVIVFGGRRSDGGAAFSDTWAYEPASNAWRALRPHQSPPVHDHVSMAYDATNKKTLLFRGPIGQDGDTVGTWAYDYKANTWTKLSTKNAPTSDHNAFIYNPNTGTTLLFGDREVWIFDYAATDWTRVSPTQPSAYREHFGMAYNEDQDVFMLIGGYPENDNWLLRVGE